MSCIEVVMGPPARIKIPEGECHQQDAGGERTGQLTAGRPDLAFDPARAKQAENRAPEADNEAAAEYVTETEGRQVAGPPGRERQACDRDDEADRPGLEGRPSGRG